MPENNEKSDTAIALSRKIHDAFAVHDGQVLGQHAQNPVNQLIRKGSCNALFDWVVKNILQKRENVVPEITVIGKHKDLYVYFNTPFPKAVSDYLVRSGVTETEFLTNTAINIHRLKTPVVRAYEVYHITDKTEVEQLDKSSGARSAWVTYVHGSGHWDADVDQ